mmetsp:Transcript_1312/g.3550  ORF Transcript_1312/g.3550 Transcript_1312/m.3550 type:complete len:87 (+) Transcript_1312:592-852(+)
MTQFQKVTARGSQAAGRYVKTACVLDGSPRRKSLGAWLNVLPTGIDAQPSVWNVCCAAGHDDWHITQPNACLEATLLDMMFTTHES